MERMIPIENKLVPESLYKLAVIDSPFNRIKILENLWSAIKTDIDKREVYRWILELNKGTNTEIRKHLKPDDAAAFDSIFNPKLLGSWGMPDDDKPRTTQQILDGIIITDEKYLQDSRLSKGEVYFFGNMSRAIISKAAAAFKIGRTTTIAQTRTIQTAPGFMRNVATWIQNNPLWALGAAIVLFFTGDYVASKTFLNKTPLIAPVWKGVKGVIGLMEYAPYILCGVGIYLLTKD